MIVFLGLLRVRNTSFDILLTAVQRYCECETPEETVAIIQQAMDRK